MAYCISRAIEGVTINGKEYLLDNDNKMIEFETESKALNYVLGADNVMLVEEVAEKFGIHIESIEESNG